MILCRSGLFPVRSQPASAQPESSQSNERTKLLVEFSVASTANGTATCPTPSVLILFSWISRSRWHQQPVGLLSAQWRTQSAAGASVDAGPFLPAGFRLAGRSPGFRQSQYSAATATTAFSAAAQSVEYGRSLPQRTQSGHAGTPGSRRTAICKAVTVGYQSGTGPFSGPVFIGTHGRIGFC